MGGERAKSIEPRPAEAEPPTFDAAFQAQFEALLRWRRDVRRFRPEPVDPACLDDLLVARRSRPFGRAQRALAICLGRRPRAAPANQGEFRGLQRRGARGLCAEPGGPLRAAQTRRARPGPPSPRAVRRRPSRTGPWPGRRTMPETVAYSAVMAAHTLWLAARARGVGVGWVSILAPEQLAQCLDVRRPTGCSSAISASAIPRPSTTSPELERHGWERRRTEASAALRR